MTEMRTGPAGVSRFCTPRPPGLGPCFDAATTSTSSSVPDATGDCARWRSSATRPRLAASSPTSAGLTSPCPSPRPRPDARLRCLSPSLPSRVHHGTRRTAPSGPVRSARYAAHRSIQRNEARPPGRSHQPHYTPLPESRRGSPCSAAIPRMLLRARSTTRSTSPAVSSARGTKRTPRPGERGTPRHPFCCRAPQCSLIPARGADAFAARESQRADGRAGAAPRHDPCVRQGREP